MRLRAAYEKVCRVVKERQLRRSAIYWSRGQKINEQQSATASSYPGHSPFFVRRGIPQYIWGSILREENSGNGIIEECLKPVLNLHKPALVVDVRTEHFPKDISPWRFIINPGTTTIYQQPTLDLAYQSREISVPVICCGASIWYRDDWKVPFNRDELTQVARRMGYPVGCRDPFTYELLTQKRIPCRFVGCPTLFPVADPGDGGYIAFSFGRKNIKGQVEVLKRLAAHHEVRIGVHWPQQLPWCTNVHAEKVVGAKQLTALYYGARAIVTGLLHAALPGISTGKPVLFFRDSRVFDSRWTLLNYLQLPVRDLSTVEDADLTKVEYSLERTAALRGAFRSYVEEFKAEFGL